MGIYWSQLEISRSIQFIQRFERFWNCEVSKRISLLDHFITEELYTKCVFFRQTIEHALDMWSQASKFSLKFNDKSFDENNSTVNIDTFFAIGDHGDHEAFDGRGTVSYSLTPSFMLANIRSDSQVELLLTVVTQWLVKSISMLTNCGP